MEGSLAVVGSMAVALISAATGIIVWFLNERSKRRAAEYRRRERRYRRLMAGINAFYAAGPHLGAVGDVDRERERFLRELRLVWLYCPDGVVRAGKSLQQAMEEPVHPTPPLVSLSLPCVGTSCRGRSSAARTSSSLRRGADAGALGRAVPRSLGYGHGGLGLPAT